MGRDDDKAVDDVTYADGDEDKALGDVGEFFLCRGMSITFRACRFSANNLSLALAR